MARFFCRSLMYFMSLAVSTVWASFVGSFARIFCMSPSNCDLIWAIVAWATFIASSLAWSSLSCSSCVSRAAKIFLAARLTHGNYMWTVEKGEVHATKENGKQAWAEPVLNAPIALMSPGETDFSPMVMRSESSTPNRKEALSFSFAAGNSELGIDTSKVLRKWRKSAQLWCKETASLREGDLRMLLGSLSQSPHSLSRKSFT